MKRTPIEQIRKFPLIPLAVAMTVLSGHAYGQGVTLDGANQSLVETISTFGNDAGVTVDSLVNSLPNTSVSSANDSTTASTATPNFSSTSLSVSFNQSTPDNKSTTSGEATVFFTDASSYSISGSMTMVGGAHTGGEISAFLYDVTTSTYVYQYDLVTGGNGTISGALNLSGGPLTGTLASGDTYEFDAFDALQKEGPQTLAGATVLTVTGVPEPSVWAMLFTGAGLLASFKYFLPKKAALARA